MLNVAFFGGWVDDRYWTYETNASVSVEEAGLSSAEVIQQQFERIRQVRDATEVGKALFGWKYSTSFGSYSKDQRQIYVFGYDRQEENRLRQLYAEQHDQALTASQRLALETVVHCDALWQKSHDLPVIYGLPVEREQLRRFLTGEAF